MKALKITILSVTTLLLLAGCAGHNGVDVAPVPYYLQPPAWIQAIYLFCFIDACFAVFLKSLRMAMWYLIICSVLYMLAVFYYANSHITPAQYSRVANAIKNQPQLIKALPSYVDDNCEMGDTNYLQFLKLSALKDSSKYIAIYQSSKPASAIKHMCAKTVFAQSTTKPTKGAS